MSQLNLTPHRFAMVPPLQWKEEEAPTDLDISFTCAHILLLKRENFDV
jgi:hypothetical protein